MRQLAILLLLACSACTTRADGPSSTSAPAEAGGTAPAASGTLGQIQALIGKAECSSDSQCQVLPIGAKACGGPAGHLAYSTAQTDTAALQAMAERYKAEQQASNQRSGRISNCMVVPAPAAACRASTCQLGEAAAVR